MKKICILFFFISGFTNSFSQDLINTGILSVSGETILSGKNIINSTSGSIKVNGQLVIQNNLTNQGTINYDSPNNSWLKLTGSSSQLINSSSTLKFGNLFIANNSNVGITDSFIEINDSISIATDGKLRLIGSSQIKQNHLATSKVKSSGSLYKDVTGTNTSYYQSSYWSSPVSNHQSNTFTIANVLKDGTTQLSLDSNIIDISFTDHSVLNGSGSTTPISISSRWLAKLENDYDWKRQLDPNSEIFKPSIGWNMKSTGGKDGNSTQNYTFVGTPNDGTYTKTVSPGTSSLVGNPYPSVINTQKFIQDNSAVIDGTLYFWEHTGESTTTGVVEGHGKHDYEGGYSQRNEAMGVAANSITDGTAGLGDATYTAPPQYIAVGQGFFVSAPANKGGTFTFDNSQRTYSTDNHFFKGRNNNAIPNFKLGFEYTNSVNAEIHRQLGINFKQGNTFEYESGFDSQTFDLQATDIYWDFPNIDSNLIIAGVGELSAQLQVPLSLIIDTDKPVKLMIDEKENMDGYNIYLVDLVTGQIFNLSTPKELNLSKGTYKDRFALIFGGTALGVDDEVLLNKISVFADNSANEIVIKNNNNQPIKKVELYNLFGQKVHDWKNLETKFENRLKTNQLPSAVYIVKVFSEKGTTSKKIIID